MLNTAKIPAGYQAVMPYLILEDAAGFLEFMKTVFGAEEKMKHLNEDGTVMHAEILHGGSCIMFAEASEAWKVNNAGMFVYVDDADATYTKAIEHGAASILEMRDQEYGRSGGVEDPFGNIWWLTSIK